MNNFTEPSASTGGIDPVETATSTAAPAEKAGREIQNKKITNYVSEASTFLATLSNDPELQAIAEAHGYDEAEMAIGIGHVTALGGKVEMRQQGIGLRQQEQRELHSAQETIREDYAAFRLIARASFPAQSDRTTLAISGDVPEDVDRFVTMARTGYTFAGQAPYTEKMTRRNYAPARLATLLEGLKTLTGEDAGRNTAEGDAITGTAVRNAAYDTLRAWMKECKGVLRGALRGQPGQLAKLKL